MTSLFVGWVIVRRRVTLFFVGWVISSHCEGKVFLGGISLEHSLSEEVPVKTQDTPYILSRCFNLLISLGSFSTSLLFRLVPLLLLQHLRFYSFLHH